MTAEIEKMNGVIKTPMDMDFAEGALVVASSIMAKRGDAPIVAVCSQSAATFEHPREAAARAGVSLIVLPEAILKRDGWAILGKRTTVWSPGA